MPQGESNLILGTSAGLSRQVAGALQRLGRPMIDLSPGADRALVSVLDPETFLARPFPVASITAVANRSVAWNRCVPGELGALVELVGRVAKTQGAQPVPLIFCVPHHQAKESLNLIRSTAPGSVIFFVPATFGPRDFGLWDTLQSCVAQRQWAQLFRRWEPKQTKLSYAGDLAATMATSTTRADLMGKNIWVPPGVSLEELQNVFLATFASETPVPWKIASRFLGHKQFEFQDIPTTNLTTGFIPYLDVFPSVLSSPQRLIKQLQGSMQKYPNLDLVFPPGRAL